MCTSKMDEIDEIDLSHLEEELEQVDNPSWNDINKKINLVKIAPIVDPVDFLAAVFNMNALVRILFTLFFKLTIGLDKLQKVMVAGYHLYKLTLIAA